MISYIFIIVCNTLSNGTVAVHCRYNVYVRVYRITSSLNVIDESHETLFYLFIQHLYSALLTKKRALIRYLTYRILTEIKYLN